MYRIVSKWNRFVPDTRTIDFVYTYIYIFEEAVKFLWLA